MIQGVRDVFEIVDVDPNPDDPGLNGGGGGRVEKETCEGKMVFIGKTKGIAVGRWEESLAAALGLPVEEVRFRKGGIDGKRGKYQT